MSDALPLLRRKLGSTQNCESSPLNFLFFLPVCSLAFIWLNPLLASGGSTCRARVPRETQSSEISLLCLSTAIRNNQSLSN